MSGQHDHEHGAHPPHLKHRYVYNVSSREISSHNPVRQVILTTFVQSCPRRGYSRNRQSASARYDRQFSRETPFAARVQLLTLPSEGDDTGYGQALFPVPADDPNDPLQWPNWKKTMILCICAAYSFLGNSSLLGPSVYIGIYAESFGISPTTASGLISYPNLAYGFGEFFPFCFLSSLSPRAKRVSADDSAKARWFSYLRI